MILGVVLFIAALYAMFGALRSHMRDGRRSYDNYSGYGGHGNYRY